MSPTSGSPTKGEFRAFYLHASVLHAIGDLTAYHIVPLPEDRIATRALPLAFADPGIPALEDPPFGDEALFAFFHMVDDTLCSRALRELAEDGAVAFTPSGWALTRAGVAAAVRLRGQFSATNVTARWLDLYLNEHTLKGLITHLSGRAKRSAGFGEIQELVHMFIANLIRRDGLRARLERSQHPSPSDLRTWVYRGACSQWRNEGRDALTRAFKGCRTEKEVQQMQETKTTENDVDFDIVQRSMPASHQLIFEGETGSPMVTRNAVTSSSLLDVVDDTDTEAKIMNRVGCTEMIHMAELIFPKIAPDRAPRYLTVLNALRERDMDGRDVAISENLSRNRGTQIIHRVHALVQTSFKVKEALDYIRAEPHATLSDIHEDVAEDLTASTLQALVDTGVLACHASKGKQSTFTLTPEGEGAFYSHLA